jgi:hypothetical protein
MYGGPRRPSAEVAVIESGRGTRLATLDRESVEHVGQKLEVLAGWHRASFTVSNSENMVFYTRIRTTAPITACIRARAGHVYTIERKDELSYDIVDGTADSSQSIDGDCSTMRKALAKRATIPSPPPAVASDSSDGAAPRPQEATGDAGHLVAPPVSATPGLSAPPEGIEHTANGISPPAPAAFTPVRHPRPGTGLRLGLEGAFGGDNLLTVGFSNGGSDSLSAGEGLQVSMGGTVTPLWIGDVLGLGAGVSIGWKGDWVTAQNGDITLSRYPLVFWLQALVPISERWYIVVSGGGHKEFDTHLSGSGVASGIDARFDSPLGWMGEIGFYYASTVNWGTGFGVRYTALHYLYDGKTIGASSVGVGFTLQFNP